MDRDGSTCGSATLKVEGPLVWMLESVVKEVVMESTFEDGGEGVALEVSEEVGASLVTTVLSEVTFLRELLDSLDWLDRAFEVDEA